ncbi:DegT/DnrJ/EryC1/StrS family aminotransferase [Catelliglobosispora koreensis]|uniref:DegT/DnrJ/EryC1/StrS family aminotransferase n=1 Tax=Catelliglobosispora koreensis TaxID=129052 RepID=UPI00036CA5D9|nr:DegT/DnrJ/EryC1/StrS family aminotransferase [Catelliglobosispora koreensis]
MSQRTSSLEWLQGYTHRAYGLFTSNGTAALELAMIVSGAGPGQEVIIPEECCTAVLSAVLRTGAQPRLAAVGADCLVTAAGIAAQLTDRTRAVIAIHQWGRRLDAIRLKSALPSSVAFIEDAASYWDPARPFQAADHLLVLSFSDEKPLSMGGGGYLGSGTDHALVATGLAGQPLFERATTFVPYACLPPSLEQLLAANRLATRLLADRRQLAAHIELRLQDAGGGMLGGISADHCWYPFPIVVDTPQTAAHLAATAHRFGLIARTLRSRPLPLTPLGRAHSLAAPPGSDFQDISDRLVIMQPPAGPRADRRIAQWLRHPTPADIDGA